MRYQRLTRTPAETDRKLLLFIIQKADIKVDYAAAAAMMSTGDIKVTEMAIQKRMGRLKELAKTASGYVESYSSFYSSLCDYSIPEDCVVLSFAGSAIQFII